MVVKEKKFIEQETQQSDIPPAPQDGPPTYQSGTGGLPGSAPITPEKPVLPKKLTIKERILKNRSLLTQEEIAGLLQVQKDASDNVIFDAIKTIAHEVYVRPENDQRTEVQVGRTKKTFDTPFEAYRWFILETLIQDVGMNDAFKKHAALLELIGEKEEEPGGLSNYINSLKKGYDERLESFLRNIDKKMEQHVGELVALFLKLSFRTERQFSDKLFADLEAIIVNVAISQRPSVAKKKIKVRDDYKEFDDPTPAQKIFNQSRALDLIKRLVEELGRADSKISDADQPLTDSKGRFMIEWLREKINLLRLDPDFYRFDKLSGSALREIAAGQAGIEQMKNVPLIDLLDLYDEKYLSFFARPFNILFAIMNQLFFDYNDGEETLSKYINQHAEMLFKNLDEAKLQGWKEETLKEIVYNTNSYKKMVEDYYQKLRTLIIDRKKAVDPYEALNKPLQDALQYEDIEKALFFLKKVAGTTDRNIIINEIIKELKTPKELFKPNADEIIAKLKKLTNNQNPEFESNIRKKIKSYIDKNKNAAIVVTILKEAIDSNKKPLVPWLIQELEKNNISITKYSKNFKGVTRTPKDVYSALGSLAGRTNVSKIIKDKNFYSLVAPYGLLMMILKEWPDEQKEKTAGQRIQILYDSLNLLDSADIRVPRGSDAKKYMTFFGQHLELLHDVRAYTGKVGELRDAIMKYHFKDTREKLKSFVDKADVGVSQDPEFSIIIDTFYRAYTQVSIEYFIDQLQKLDKGQAEQELSCMPIVENINTYVVMKDVFKPLLELIVKDGKPIKLDDIDISALQKELVDIFKGLEEKIKKKVSGEKIRNENMGCIRVFVENMISTLQIMKEEVPKESEQPSSSIFPSGGPPPAPGGGPPPVPGGSRPPVPKV